MAIPMCLDFCPGKRTFLIVIFCCLLLPFACTQKSGETQSIQQPKPIPPSSKIPTGAKQSVAAENGDWIMPGKNFAGTRFSELNQINTGNVKNLRLAWTFSTGVNRGQEAAPIVVG